MTRAFFSRLRRSWLRPTAEDVSAFGQHRKFPPHARKTSGTQGKRRLIDLSKIEKRVRFLAPCGSRIVKFLIHYWFVRGTTNTKGKECGPNLSGHLWGGELRDDTKNGCVADYAQSSMRQYLLIVVFNS